MTCKRECELTENNECACNILGIVLKKIILYSPWLWVILYPTYCWVYLDDSDVHLMLVIFFLFLALIVLFLVLIYFFTKSINVKNYINEVIESCQVIVIWLMPLLLAYCYFLYSYYLLNQYYINFTVTIFGAFFAGTLAYYGVIYTLTYRVKVEVLSKNRQDWINELRKELSVYLTNCSLVETHKYEIPTLSDHRKIKAIIDQTYHTIYFYLNKNEDISNTLLSVMSALVRSTERMEYLIEIVEDLKENSPNYREKYILLMFRLHSDDFNSVECSKVKKHLSHHRKFMNTYKAQQYSKMLDFFAEDMVQEYVLLSKIDAVLSSSAEYNIREIENVFDKEGKFSLHEKLLSRYQKLATILLKKEWERVKRTR